MTNYQVKGTGTEESIEEFLRKMEERYGTPKMEEYEGIRDLTYQNLGIEIIIHDDGLGSLLLTTFQDNKFMKREDFGIKESALLKEINSLEFNLEEIK